MIGRHSAARVLWFGGFLLPIAYFGFLLSTAVHEVLGHGLVALAVGGSFSGFSVFWNGAGFAWANAAGPVPGWHDIAIGAGGIVATTVLGTALCLVARRRKTASTLGAVPSVIGPLMLIGGPSYAFWGALDPDGHCDPANVLRMLGADAVGRGLWLVTAAVLLVFSAWWGLRILWRHVETQLGGGVAMSLPRRAVWLLVLVVPAAACSHAVSGAELVVPRLGRLPLYLGLLAVAAVSAVVARFPLPPFPVPWAPTPLRLIGAWAVLAALLVGLKPWRNDVVLWSIPPLSRMAEAITLSVELDGARSSDEVARLDRLAEEVLASIPRSDPGAKLLVALGSAWRREGNAARAMECFERLGLDWSEKGTPWAATALSLEVGVLKESLRDLDGAVRRVERFLTDAQGADRNAALRLLAMLEGDRGRCAESLAAWKAWIPMAGDEGSAERTEAQLRMARCHAALGETAAALGLLERRLADEQEPWSPEVALDYVQHAGRAGRIEQARSFVGRLSVERRDRCSPYVEFISAWLARDPGGALQFLATGDIELLLLDRVTPLFMELGPPTLSLLAERIRQGDRIAIQMAARSRSRELLTPLESRRALGGPDGDSLDSAISRLQAETSRPSAASSRTAK